MEFVCDNSELNGIWGAESPDVLVVGGYAIPRDKVSPLLKKVEQVKANRGLNAHCPVKWNMRDLDRALVAHGLLGQKDILIGQSNLSRAELLNELTATGAKMFVSVIRAHSNKKQILGETHEDLVRFSFGNLLMRAGLFCRETANGRRVDILLDWPERNDHGPFAAEYYTGWRYGRSGPEGNSVKYECGALSDIAFTPTSIFAGTEFEPRLAIHNFFAAPFVQTYSIALPKPAVSDGKVLLRILRPASRRSTIRFSPANTPSRRPRWSWATKERAWWRREAERTFLSVHA